MIESGAALFAGSAQDFIHMAPESTLTTHLVREFNRRWGTVGELEVGAWRRSLTALAHVVAEADLLLSGVGVELKLPLTNRRVDASFVARDGDGAPHVVLVELKQWQSAGPSLFPDNVVVGGHEALHPSVQASGYATYLRASHSAFTEEGFRLSACAYLHEMPVATAHAIRGVRYAGALTDAPLYARSEEPMFRTYLTKSLSSGDGMALLPSLVAGRYQPSKGLLAAIAKALQGAPMWTLLDEQREAFNIVRGLVERAGATGRKSVVLVVGGPGTGKSIIAAHLLIALGADGTRRVCHATGSKAFTTNLRALSPGGGQAIFRYFNNFREKDTAPDSVDVIVCDEAHRLRETSNDRFTSKARRSEISQAREIIRAARVSVFCLDERQNVRPDEVGSVTEVRAAADDEGADVHEVALAAQFRCNGCVGYVEWVDRLFSERPEPAGAWLAATEYDLRLFGDPGSMETAIKGYAVAGRSARLVAGFCWRWSDPLPGGALYPDVKIGTWRRPWNAKAPEQRKPPGPQPRADRHPYYLWATRPESIAEVGCIYSAQGFEFDYCGVILGNDLVWREDVGWVASRDASADPALKRARLDPVALSRLLQHTYRVLLTRGMRGTFVYSTDYETRELLRRLLIAEPRG